MCLGGGGGSTPQPKYLSRTDPDPGPASPPDAVNNQIIEKAKDVPKAGDTNKKKVKAQSSKNTGRY